MKNAFSVLALSSALFLTGIAALPASAQPVDPEVNGPQAIKYSWGVQIATNEGPSRSYTWADLQGDDAPRSVRSLSVGRQDTFNPAATLLDSQGGRD